MRLIVGFFLTGIKTGPELEGPFRCDETDDRAGGFPGENKSIWGLTFATGGYGSAIGRVHAHSLPKRAGPSMKTGLKAPCAAGPAPKNLRASASMEAHGAPQRAADVGW